MFCVNCGVKLADGAQFCTHCGTRVPNVSPRPAGTAKRTGNVFDMAAEKLNELAGGSGKVNLSFGDFFAETFKHHSKEETEELFICGTPSTTPALKDVSIQAFLRYDGPSLHCGQLRRSGAFIRRRTVCRHG